MKRIGGSWISQVRVQYKKIPTYQQIPGANRVVSTEAAPNISSERYNHDRMFMILRNFDFREKRILDIGCNAGWFCHEIASIGASYVCGIDYDSHPEMGGNLRYAAYRAKKDRLPIEYYDCRLSGKKTSDLDKLMEYGKFDFVLLLSVMHHIDDPEAFISYICKHTRSSIIYEHHEFWNDIYNDKNQKILFESGNPYRFNWNRDLSWIDNMSSVSLHSNLVIPKIRHNNLVRVFIENGFSEIKFLGFSEKRRPILSFSKVISSRNP